MVRQPQPVGLVGEIGPQRPVSHDAQPKRGQRWDELGHGC